MYTALEYIVLPLETSCFCGIGQPLNFSLLASLLAMQAAKTIQKLDEIEVRRPPLSAASKEYFEHFYRAAIKLSRAYLFPDIAPKICTPLGARVYSLCKYLSMSQCSDSNTKSLTSRVPCPPVLNVF